VALGLFKRKISDVSDHEAPGRRPARSADRPDKGETPLRLIFEETAAALKSSKFAKGRAGAEAMTALPWYLVLGPSGSGKRSFLRHSGLQFPLTSARAKFSDEEGVSDPVGLWCANEGVFLDLAGSLIDDDARWDTCLKLIKHYRKSQAVNGILLLVSLPNLAAVSRSAVDASAQAMRTRLNQAMQRLGVVCPVYLAFTQCDRILGFRETFSALAGAERDQVWGVTFPNRAAVEQPAKRFEEEFGRLQDQVSARVPFRIGTAGGADEARGIAVFPRQLAAMQDATVRFIDVLFQSSAFQESPLLRGVYFTSATEQGDPIDYVLDGLARTVGVTTVIGPSVSRSPAPRSAFIKELLTGIVAPDATLVTPTTETDRRHRRLLMGGLVGVSLTTLLLTGGLIRSYVNNRDLATDLLAAEKQSLRMTFHDERRFADNVLLLDRFRVPVEELAAYEKQGVPLRLSLGLYRGTELSPVSRDVFFHLFNTVYLDHTRTAIEAALKHFLAQPASSGAAMESDSYYTLLKLYLMLSEPNRLDRDYVAGKLRTLWDGLLASHYGTDVPKELPEAIHGQIDLYAGIVDAGHLPLPTIDHNLVSRVRLALHAIPLPHRYFSRMQREAPSITLAAFTPEPYRIDKAVAGQRQVVLTNTLAVPALFTPDGWRILFPFVRDKVLKEAGQEAWVLNVEEVPPKEMEAAIERIYFDEYVRQWRRFVQGTKMLSAERLPDIANRLEVLSRKNSQLLALLKDVDRHTRLVSLTEQAQDKFFDLLPGAKSSETPVQKNPVQLTFESFHEFVTPFGEAKEAAVDKYMAELGKAASSLAVLAQAGPGDQDLKDPRDLRQARLATEVLLRQLEGEVREDFRPLLVQPFLLAQATATKGELHDLNRAMKQDLAGLCSQTVASRYPFRKSDQPGGDLTFTDLAAFFHPQSGAFWRFYQSKLKSSVQEENGRWVVKVSDMPVGPGFLETLRQADLISQGFFGKGTPEPRIAFELRPNGVPGVDEVRLHIDGRELRYRNEVEEWFQFVWPGTPETSGATLHVVSSGSAQPNTLHFDGRWGLFRLLDEAHVTQVRPTEYTVEWTVPGADGVPVKVRFDLKADAPKNLFAPGLFSRFRCPAQVGT
jgi:type VI secretion system protein ImpL